MYLGFVWSLLQMPLKPKRLGGQFSHFFYLLLKSTFLTWACFSHGLFSVIIVLSEKHLLKTHWARIYRCKFIVFVLAFEILLFCFGECVKSFQPCYSTAPLCVFLLPRCPDGPRPSTVRPCQLPCKKDCIVTPFSDWTPCPVTCDAGTVGKKWIAFKLRWPSCYCLIQIPFFCAWHGY